ncbi:hypothetical protein FHW02_003976 [Ochrobactrum sp. RH1CCR137]|nr:MULTISPECIES: hypothetical protein [unclassified Ochrobactrum]MBA8845889.1 hypothetical protein [Ochrobactrum sp. RH1CCR137]MBA8857611.1 hypothetical protein [Ochrobactrum sp. RH1CCR134]
MSTEKRRIADLDEDELISLAEAVEIFFSGRLSKSSLRTEAAKGNLEIIRIANKDFVTRNGIRRMIERCRVKLTPTPEISASVQNWVCQLRTL